MSPSDQILAQTLYLKVLYRIVTSVCIQWNEFRWVSNRFWTVTKYFDWNNFFQINWTSFEMADKQPSYHCWFSSQQYVYMASYVKKYKRQLCTVFKTVSLFQAFSISFSYYFHFLLFVSKLNMKFCCKTFLLPIISHYHWTQNRKSVIDEIWNPRACSSQLFTRFLELSFPRKWC